MRNLCECGCGRETKIRTRSHTASGAVRGMPFRFIAGHAIRIVQQLTATRYPGRAIGGGKADAIHRIRAAQALGKPLPAGAEVHHVDGSMNPDAPLVICQDAAYHSFLHYRMRIVRDGFDPNTHRRCSRCKTYKPLAAFSKRKANIVMGLASYCRPCWSQQKGFGNRRHSVKAWVSA
jgi:hypothetical protein